MGIENEIIGECYKPIIKDVKKYARAGLQVLFIGPTGTGKELLAKLYVEAINKIPDTDMETINCAALSKEIIESELFGHKKGAFTSATESRPGRLKTACNKKKIIFLDEIGDLSKSLQAKLLRFVENGEIQPVGSDEIGKLGKVMCIAATNRINSLRDDLRYRFHEVIMPNYNDEFFAEIIQHYLKQQKLKSVTEKALAALFFYEWPGNAREIKNTIERIATKGQDKEILYQDLPPNITEHYNVRFARKRMCFADNRIIKTEEIIEWCAKHPTERNTLNPMVQDMPHEHLSVSEFVDILPVAQGQQGTTQTSRNLKDIEQEHIIKVLNECEWVKELAAKKLGIHKKTLQRKIAEYGCSRREKQAIDG